MPSIFPDAQELREWNSSYLENHKLRIASDLDIVRSRAPPEPHQKILEIGSIPLLLTAALSKCGYHIIGCDIAPERYASVIANTGIEVVKCNIETDIFPFSDNFFDVIICNEIFEHLRLNPIFTLSEVLRILKPNGQLMLSTPNLRSLKGITNFLVRNKAYSCSGNIYVEYQKLSKLGHMGHVREYTTTEMVEFLENLGFVVTRILFRGRYRGYFPRFLVACVPGLSPFVSYLAVKPDDAVSRLRRVPAPALDHDLSLAERVEDFPVQQLVS